MKSPSNRVRLILWVLICIQPFLDVASYWLNRTGESNELTLVIRFGLLAITVALGFIHSEKKRVYAMLGGISLALVALHCFACLQAGYADPASDLVNQVRILVLPWTALAFMTFLRQGLISRREISRCFAVNLAVILLVEVLATVTGTDPHTYANKALGICGWFYFPNSQSAILTMLIPTAMVWALEERPSLPVSLGVAGVCFGILYLFATRLSFLGLVLTGAALGGAYLFSQKQQRKLGAVILGAALVFLLLYPASPMAQNAAASAHNFELRQEWIDRQLAESTEEDSRDAYEAIYSEYLPGLVEHFGWERTAQAYGYRTDSQIAESRPAKLMYSRLLLEDSPRSAYLFGMEISRWSTSVGSYDVENDIHGIFFLCGGVGLAALLVFLLYYVFCAMRLLLRSPKAVFSPGFLCWVVAALCCAAHIYATAGVLRRPNASFYLALCLAVIWYMADPRSDAHPIDSCTQE